MITQATTLGKALVIHIAGGCKIRTEEEQEAIKEICNTCNHFKNNRCNLCGCYIRFKSMMLNEHCPEKKW